jgi:hypothetical protein
MRIIVFFALLLVGLVYSTFATGCSALSTTADDAKNAVIDCASGELSNLKPVAISMVPELTAGDLEWKTVEGAAIAAGARFGGCLLKHLHDVIPRPSSFVGVPSQAELAIYNLRRATGSRVSYRTEAGTL